MWAVIGAPFHWFSGVVSGDVGIRRIGVELTVKSDLVALDTELPRNLYGGLAEELTGRVAFEPGAVSYAAYTTLAVVTFDAKKSAQYGFYRSADRAFTRDGLIAAEGIVREKRDTA